MLSLLLERVPTVNRSEDQKVLVMLDTCLQQLRNAVDNLAGDPFGSTYTSKIASVLLVLRNCSERITKLHQDLGQLRF